MEDPRKSGSILKTIDFFFKIIKSVSRYIIHQFMILYQLYFYNTINLSTAILLLERWNTNWNLLDFEIIFLKIRKNLKPAMIVLINKNLKDNVKFKRRKIKIDKIQAWINSKSKCK